jgi:hypothetical protein
MRVAAQLKQPTRGSEGTGHPLFLGGNSPLLGLAPDGVCMAGMVTHPAGGLLHRRFTLTLCLVDTGRYAFCCTVPSGHPAWLLASTTPYGVRTFLIPRGTRLPDQLGCNYSISHNPTNVKLYGAIRHKIKVEHSLWSKEASSRLTPDVTRNPQLPNSQHPLRHHHRLCKSHRKARIVRQLDIGCLTSDLGSQCALLLRD